MHTSYSTGAARTWPVMPMPGLQTALWVLVLLGYPVAAMIATVLAWDSSLTSHPLRIGVAMLCLAALAGNGLGRAWRRLHPGLKVFFLAYMARLLWDAFVVGRAAATEALLMFVLITLLPTMALLSGRQFPGTDRNLAQPVALLGAAICMLALIARASGASAELTELTGRLYIEALNPISLGHVAATTSLACLVLLLGPHGHRWLPIALVAMAVALVCLALTASRGPLLALVLALALPLWRSRYRFALIVLLAASTVLWVPYLLQSDLALFARLLAGGEDESSMERLLVQSNALGLFMQSPLIGSAFAEFELDTYPHNVFIETAMALGVVGLVALAWALKDGIRGLRSAPHRQSLLLAMVFVQYLCAFQFSGAIYGSAVFWATLAWFSAVRKRAPGRRPTHEVLPMASRS